MSNHHPQRGRQITGRLSGQPIVKLTEWADKIEAALDRQESKGGNCIALSAEDCRELLEAMRNARRATAKSTSGSRPNLSPNTVGLNELLGSWVDGGME